MLVRLLVVVLTLAGPVPVRLCACDDADHAPATPCDDGARPGGHHCDCPVAAPQPAAAPAPVDAAADAGHAAPALLDIAPPVRVATPIPEPDPPPRTLPLYLSLRTLRI